ncbi:MAG TPA: hypothetical protein VKR61_24765 [Bryobacteraceae bacterium]|nr:hypothetical protein [Bryobacteraceae bacterium]
MRAKTASAAPEPAATAAAPAAGPQPPVQSAAAPRKTSPIVWILVAVLGLFVLTGIAVVGAGVFLVHKAKQAGLDPELMRNNPGLATAKLLAATNPDLEVVSVDDGRGRITIRQKSTGKTMTVSFDDMKRGRITFKEDGKDAVTLEAHGDGQTGSLQMKSGSESLTLGANQATLPAWIPAYPNAKTQSNFAMNTKDGATATFQFQTQDALKDVLAFYDRGLKQNGFKINATSTSDSGASSSGLISAEDQDNKRNVMVTVGTDAKGTTVGVTYTQK